MTASGDRLPPLTEDQLSSEQRVAVEEIVAGPRAELLGPFVPLLRSPQLMRCLQKTGDHLRFHAALAPRLFEMGVLLVAREWDQLFEWRYHCPLALRAGVEREVVRAIAERRHPVGLASDAEVTWQVCDQLHRTKSVRGETFAAAVAQLGESATVELVAAVGYYTTLAMVMNASATPPPPALDDAYLDLAQGHGGIR